MTRLTTPAPARPEEAPDIYRLLTEAFGPSYLKFTVYQSPLSVGYIREQIKASLAAGSPTFFVLRGDGGLAGFYNAVRQGGESFLNYVATTTAARGKGTGRQLLDHFECTAAVAGCLSVGLDVFRSNAVASEWYARRGYVSCAVRYHLRFALEALVSEGTGVLEFDPAGLERALQEEASRGFSSIPCFYRGTPVKLGLIGGAVCNLLEPRGGMALAPAQAVARVFAGRRRWLLAASPEPLPEAARAESVEEALHMTRPVPTGAVPWGGNPR